MKRVLVGGIKHEAATFVPGVFTLETFRLRGLFEGEEMLGPAHGSGQEIDGVIAVAKENDVELIPTLLGWGGAGPVVADAAYEYMRDIILAGARANRGRLDGVMLTLHGGMTTESLEDPEGDLITRVREIVGPDVPIAVSFDLHCHLTELTVRPADIIVGFHTYPHVDMFDTGVRGMRALVKAMNGEAKPVIAYRKLRMVTSAENQDTNQGPGGEIMARIKEIEQEPGILAATIFATQPWMDVPQFGWSFVVVADGDQALAQAKADELGMMAWERRERFLVHKTPVKEAIQQALAGEGQPYVMSDSSDAVTGGAHGDGNLLLRALLEMNYQGTALMAITDPEAVTACFAAGVGGMVTIPVGGKITTKFYQPVLVTGRVKTLTDGTYMAVATPRLTKLGRTAVLQVGGIHLLLSEHKTSVVEPAPYRSAGLEPKSFKIVQVKSPSNFRVYYGPFAAGIFHLDLPGPTDSELPRLPFKNIRRPLWPFDMDLQAPW